GVLWVTARRHNGWAGLHDLQSGTRVVARAPSAQRQAIPGLTSPDTGLVPAPGGRHYGPFIATSESRRNPSAAAFDPLLRRQVWLQLVPEDAPPVSAVRRDLARPERLFWLTGRRSATENWDAFEAPDGESFLKRRAAGVSWPILKLWLMDLVKELQAGIKDGSLPRLGLDRIWIRSDQRLVLLDFSAPDSVASAESEAPRVLSPVELLSAVASAGLHANKIGTPREPSLPLSARVLLDRLVSSQPPSLEEIDRSLWVAARTPDTVHRWRRSIPILLAAVPTVSALFLTLFVMPMLVDFLTQNAAMISSLELLRIAPREGGRLTDPEIREAFEKYIAGTYRAELANETFWNSPVMRRMSENRKIAEDLLARHPVVSAEDLNRARAVVEPEIGRLTRSGERDRAGIAGVGVIIAQSISWMAILGVFGLSVLWSLIVPGGILARFVGLAVVTRDGAEISRWRSLVRVLIAWSPAIIWLIVLAASPRIQGWVPNPSSPVGIAIPTLGVLAAGALWAIVRPVRGLQDHLAGTWIVPR
ncbi:MAG TPA: hypothetical protein VFR05_10300, partial [Terriglobia bacterium]|nr:hypothetical protein [Terriglobia bacterium]